MSDDARAECGINLRLFHKVCPGRHVGNTKDFARMYISGLHRFVSQLVERVNSLQGEVALKDGIDARRRAGLPAMDATSRAIEANRKARAERAERRQKRKADSAVAVAEFKRAWDENHKGQDYGNILNEWFSYDGTLTLPEFIKMRTNEDLLKTFLSQI